MGTWDALYTQQYDSNLRLASQQRESRLLRTVNLDKQAGVNKYFEKILPLGAPTPRGARFQPITLQDTPFERRMLSPISYDDVRGVDSLDKMRTTVEDPTSKIMLEQAWAFNRNIDDTIIAAITGSAFVQATVNTSPTVVSLPAGQAIPVNYDEPGTGQSGNTAMTVGKLKYAKVLLQTAEAVLPGQEIFAILNSTQISQLLRDAQITNIFYNDLKPLVDNDLTRAIGLTIIRSERILNTSSAPFQAGQSTALVYPMEAAEFGWLEPLHGRVDYLPERRGETYGLKTMGSYGATRMFEEKVVTILSDNTQ